MAPSSFFRHFRKITGARPLQYQKQLRLQEAQRLMLTGNYNAEQAIMLDMKAQHNLAENIKKCSVIRQKLI